MPQEKDSLMARALELAARGLGAVEPNPMVGAVISRDGREVASGWHRRFGGPHAEIEALSAAAAAGRDVRGATMHVTLEPCAHYGKTPPCADALIRAGLGRVVVAMADPDERVSGRGIARLREAGIAVEVGAGQEEARRLLGPYVKLRTRGRPWVILKWAQTADGYLALPGGTGRWVSCEESRRRVHELRGLCDGVCVGAGTVLADDPLLTHRLGAGKQPARVVLDGRLRMPPTCRLARTACDAQPVIVATTEAAVRAAPDRAAALRGAGVEVHEVPPSTQGVSLPALLDELGRRQWTRLLVEGGAAVLDSFTRDDLADELWAFVAPSIAADPALPRFDLEDLRGRMLLPEPVEERVGADRLLRYRLST